MRATTITPALSERELPAGNIKVTRDDWLRAALEILTEQGVESVRVQPIGARLKVSRSSFYWYFKSRQDLLDQLLAHWEATNTRAIVGQAEAEAQTITGAVCNIFRCIVNPALFSTRLDLAIREWARRSHDVREVLRQSEETRVNAIAMMFERFGYPEVEALTRARVLYYMQIGYDDAPLRETKSERMRLVPHYLRCFTGKEPQTDELEAFSAYVETHFPGEDP